MSYLLDTSVLIEIENNNQKLIDDIIKIPYVLDLNLHES